MDARIRPRGPYDFSRHLRIASRSPREPVDRVDGGEWSRVFLVGDTPVLVRVREAPGSTVAAPELTVRVTPDVDAGTRDAVLRKVAHALAADADPGAFARAVVADPVMADLARRQEGLKPFRMDGLYEALVWSVIGQQITLAFAFALKERLVTDYGVAVAGRRGFPRPEVLARVPEEDLRALKFSRQKARYLRTVAEAAASGHLDAGAFSGVDDADAVATLTELKGIGRWSAEYALLRGLGRDDLIPAADVGLLNAAGAVYGMDPRPTEAGLRDLADAWRPYRGWGAFHLWHTLLPPAEK